MNMKYLPLLMSLLSLLLLLLLLLVGCQATLSPVDDIRISTQFERVNEMAAIPRESPTLYYNTDPGWPIAALANCDNWSITINYELAANYPDFVIVMVLPHEFAHLVSCYYRGSTENEFGDSHDSYWKEQVKRLGGDENYV